MARKGKRSEASESETAGSKRPRASRQPRPSSTTATPEPAPDRALAHPWEWFDRRVARELWLSGALSDAQPRIRSGGVVDPLLTSWFEVRNYSDVPHGQQWLHERPGKIEPIHENLSKLAELATELGAKINSVLKVKLKPTTSQRAKLDQLFATHRAVYNMPVVRSRNDCKWQQGESTDRWFLNSVETLRHRCRFISIANHMSKYFNNRRSLLRHRVVPSSVSNGAIRDFLKAVRSSRALYFALKAKNATTTFPVIEFKSKLTPSDTIEIPKNLVSIDQDR